MGDGAVISHVRKLSRGPLVAKPVVRTPPARYDDPWGVVVTTETRPSRPTPPQPDPGCGPARDNRLLCRFGIHRGTEYGVRFVELVDGSTAELAHPHAFLRCPCGATTGHWFVRRRGRPNTRHERG